MDEIAIEKYLEENRGLATVIRRETWGREQSEKRYSFIKNEEHRRTGSGSQCPRVLGSSR